MYRLRTFGGLVLERDGERLDAVAANRKALSLLAALAAHGSLGRERLMSLLWPESDSERARGSLKQTVHLLRRHLQEPELLLGTAELRLNPQRITSDIEAFVRALREGDLEAAVDLYEGPFLDGVYVEGTPEFERWVEGRRGEFAGRFAGALEELALAAEGRGEPLEAVAWWRRLQEAEPFNSRAALRLMQALDAAGDPAAALRHARIHELLLEGELGIPPDPAIVELTRRLRSPAGTPPPPGTPLPQEVPPAPSGIQPSPGSAPSVQPTGGLPVEGLPARAPAERAGLRLVVPLAVFLAAAALLLLVALWGSALWHPSAWDGMGPEVGTGTSTPATPAGGVAGGAALPAVAAAPASLAVLPFVDMSPEGDQEYFADGITEEILNTLVQRTELRVPARSSSFYFKGRNLPVREIATQLGVEVILEGSVRRSGDRIRITVQLIDALADSHLWSETFDRDLGDVLAVQTEISELVAEALRVRMVPSGGGRGSAVAGSAEAHDLYLRGLFHWNRRSAADLALAVRFFEEATRLDPDYARAWAGLALAHAVIPIAFTPIMPQDQAWSRMEEAAARTLALDPGLAEGHAALGLGYHFQWRWEDAEVEYRRALALNPDYPTAHQWYGEHLAKTGRGEEGVRALRRAVELDPLSLVVHNDLGLVLMLNRQFPEAIDQWERTVGMDPGFAIPLFFLHRIHLMEGRLDTAAAWGRRWAELTGLSPADEMVTLSLAPGDPSLREPALDILRRWTEGATPRWLDIAFYHVHLGEHGAALDALEQGVRNRAPMMAQIGHGPWLDPLRGEDRWARILEEVGFR